MLRLVARLFLSLTMVCVSAPVAFAQQFIGTFRWQLAPYCNVVTLNVTQHGNTFALGGFDDQCGAATQASIAGTAFPNPNGSIGIGLSLITTPGAAPVHVDVALTLATIGGPWRDSAGNTGTFIFSPPTPAPGAPRPPTGGLISTVTPGAGLTGGGTTGAVTLAVTYAGSGSATTVARSDHTHGLPGLNTVVGGGALDAITTGFNNTAVGASALVADTTGSGNSADHSAAYVAGIIGQSVDAMTDRTVLIDATGKLGTIASSARFKQDIRPLDDISRAVMGLEPVSFRYRSEQQRGDALQYGLIAEQVADVMPDLVIRDAEGRPLTVKYHVLPTLLLAEIQRLERGRAAQANEIQALRDELRALAHDRR